MSKTKFDLYMIRKNLFLRAESILHTHFAFNDDFMITRQPFQLIDAVFIDVLLIRRERHTRKNSKKTLAHIAIWLSYGDFTEISPPDPGFLVKSYFRILI